MVGESQKKTGEDGLPCDGAKGLFEDSARVLQAPTILRICSNYSIALINRIKFLKPCDYNLASSKKKIRDTTAGEMQGFKNRLKENSEMAEDEDVRIFINPSELRQMNIEVP